jgi:signal transduction histidine kinase
MLAPSLFLAQNAGGQRLTQEEQLWQLSRLGLADLIDIITHEFNNVLNNILMHLALVERSDISADLRDQTVAVRRKGLRDVNLLKRLQQFSRSEQPPLQSLELNRILDETIAELSNQEPAGSDRETVVHPLAHSGKQRPGIPLRTELASDLPPVLGTAFDLKRVISLLLQHAAAVAPAGGSITIRTSCLENHCQQLRVEDTGPSVAAEKLADLFQPFAVVRPGDDGIRLTICKAIARRLQAKLLGEIRPEGGMAFVVELRSAGEPDTSPR